MDIIQIVIQAGAVGIAVYTIYTLNKIVSNHLNHLTDAINRLENTLLELQQFLKDKL